jgi:hypothetical protein
MSVIQPLNADKRVKRSGLPTPHGTAKKNFEFLRFISEGEKLTITY